jgi:hypothetical protein
LGSFCSGHVAAQGTIKPFQKHVEGRERCEIIGKHYVSDLTDGNIDAKIKLVIAKDAAQT